LPYEEAKSAVAVIKQLENEINETEAELADVTARSAMLQNQVAMNSQERHSHEFPQPVAWSAEGAHSNR